MKFQNKIKLNRLFLFLPQNGAFELANRMLTIQGLKSLRLKRNSLFTNRIQTKNVEPIRFHQQFALGHSVDKMHNHIELVTFYFFIKIYSKIFSIMYLTIDKHNYELNETVVQE